MRSHNVDKQPLGKDVGVRGPRFVEVVIEGKTIVFELSVIVAAIFHERANGGRHEKIKVKMKKISEL